MHDWRSFLALAVSAAALTAGGPSMASEPDFGPAVLIFEPGAPDVQSRLDAVFARQEASEFGQGRYALLFKPGRHRADVRVGFYTHVAGLGKLPDDVTIEGAVRATAEWRKGNATCNFWRCVENLAVQPSDPSKPNVWAVSQGVSMRRVHVLGDLNLSDGGWSSGGFLADSRIDGTVDSGTQQQWFARNSSFGRWKGGNWNMVFVGAVNPPEADWPKLPYSVVAQTPVVREKPFLFIGDQGRYFVARPSLRRDAAGVSWEDPAGEALPIESFHIARADRDDAASINAALAAGKHLLLTPGIYRLGEPLRVSHPGTVVLGIGYPTLVTTRGNAALSVTDVPGVHVAGVLIEAGPVQSPALIEVGVGGAGPAGGDPIVLSDVFCRVGGAAPGKADAMLRVRASGVIGDNLWLWRADHGEGAAWDVNFNRNGLLVEGDDVTMYGLFVEHQHEYQTIWNGERGRVFFYQSEMPYDPPSAEAWSHDGETGYASYKVGDRVRTHEAIGVGVYCVFKQAPVVAARAIEAPEAPGVKLRHLITIRLSGLPGSGIARVLNARGEPVIEHKKATLD